MVHVAQSNELQMPKAKAAFLTSLFWGSLTIGTLRHLSFILLFVSSCSRVQLTGRFFSIYLAMRFEASKILRFNALGAVSTCLLLALRHDSRKLLDWLAAQLGVWLTPN